MAKKSASIPCECVACGCTAVSKVGNVMTCDHAHCPAVGRLEYRLPKKGLADDKVGWHLNGRKVKSVLDIYGSYPPGPTDFVRNDPADDDGGFTSKWGYFSANLCSKFLFPDEDNNDIDRRLEKAGVIKTKTDSEGDEMYVYFDSKQEADAFYVRLWDYLRKRWLAIHDIKKKLRELP